MSLPGRRATPQSPTNGPKENPAETWGLWRGRFYDIFRVMEKVPSIRSKSQRSLVAARVVEAERDQVIHALLAHVAERHRRADSMLWVHSMIHPSAGINLSATVERL